MRRRYALVLNTLAALATSPTYAAKPARACIEAHANGQVDRDAGRLLQASQKFRACAADACPALIRKECGELGASLEAQIPSVLIRAEDGTGKPMAGAHAIIDGERSVPITSTAVPLNPGVHEIDVVLADGRRQTVNLSLSFSEKARPALATFLPPPKPPGKSGPGNAVAYVLGGAGLVALSAWGAFAWDGRRRQSDLETCAPRCTSASEVDAMRRSYLIADVLLGVSAAALGTSAYLLITNSAEPEHNERTLMLGARGRF